jgi:hypothetical protein
MSRKITQLAIDAFLSSVFAPSWTLSNTSVVKSHSSLYSYTTLKLHGHDIANRIVDNMGNEKTEITNA